MGDFSKVIPSKGFLNSQYKPSSDEKPIGKTSVRYKGKLYRRYKTGYSPEDRQYQKESHNPKAFFCECRGTEEFGKYHFLGCDGEQCPICKRQLLSCGHGPLFETKYAKCK